MRTLALCLLAACAAEPALDAAALPVDAAAGPFIVPFQAPAIYPGQSAVLSVSGLPVGARVTFLRSERGAGAGPCHPTYPICAGLLGPLTVLGTATVATGGNAALTWNVPNNAQAGQWLQAVVTIPNTTLAASSAVLVRVPGDGDLDFVPDALDNCPVDANPGQLDADGDDYGEACDCDDINAAVNPAAVEIPGNPVDEDCDGVAVGSWAGDYAGDVDGFVSLLGVVVDCNGPFAMTVLNTQPLTFTGGGECVSLFGGPVAFTVEGEIQGDDATGEAFTPLGTFPFLGTFSTQGQDRIFASQATFTGGGTTVVVDIVADDL